MDCILDNNTLSVDITVQSPISKKISSKIKAKIDTGFTGDLSLTYQQAFPLALSLIGYEPWTLADNKTVYFMECFGFVTLGNKTVATTIDVKPSGSILIGMNLLKKFGCKLNINFVTNKSTLKV